MKDKRRTCELCDGEASFYCAADSAFLCRSCDARVHQVNFLVARHVRRSLCYKCSSPTGNFVSNSRSGSLAEPICHSCSRDHDQSFVSSFESDCNSSTESSAESSFIKWNNNSNDRKSIRHNAKISVSSSLTDVSGENSNIPARSGAGISTTRKERNLKKLDSKAAGIFMLWCKRLGLNSEIPNVVSVACHAFELCWENLKTVLPFRVTLAASFWLGLRMGGGDPASTTCHNLKRIEEVSGVPTKLIVAVETRLSRVMRIKKRSARLDLEEGWAECNV